MLFALDLDYKADREARVFQFGAPRPAVWTVKLPAYLGTPVDCFRLDADGIHDVAWDWKDGQVVIRDTCARVGIYFATPNAALRNALADEHQQCLAAEAALNFDPARSDADFAQLEQLLSEN